MAIQAVSTHRTIPLTSVIRGSSGSGRVSLPVSSSNALYARFKHVSGRPDPSGGGFPVSKLRTIDTLIDRLVKMKNREAMSLPSGKDLTGLSEKSMDALIQDLSKKLHAAYVKADTNPFLSAGTGTGIVADFKL